MEERECSETSAYKIQTLGNYLEESIQHSEHGESMKSRKRKISPTLILFKSHPLALCTLLQHTLLTHWYCPLFV